MTDKAGLTLPLRCLTPLGPVPRILIQLFSGWALIIGISLSSHKKPHVWPRRDPRVSGRNGGWISIWHHGVKMQEAVGLSLSPHPFTQFELKHLGICVWCCRWKCYPSHTRAFTDYETSFIWLSVDMNSRGPHNKRTQLHCFLKQPEKALVQW